MASWVEELRENVRAYAAKRNMSQDDLAKRLGRTQSALSHFLSGKGLPRETILDSLVDMVREDHPEYGLQAHMQLIECASCNRETASVVNGRRARYCSHCAADITRLCPQCQQPNLPRAQFCMQCGHKLPMPKKKTQPDGY